MFKERFAFIVGLGASLASVALIAHIVGEAQLGPRWEVPERTATALFLVPLVSIVLTLVAIGAYVVGDHFRLHAGILRFCFWAAVTLSSLSTAGVYMFQPGQWPVRSAVVSGVARSAAMPVVIACAVSWLLLSAIGWMTFRQTVHQHH